MVWLFAVCLMTGSTLRKNMDRRTFEELSASAKSQASYLSRALESQYAPLESLSYYLGTQEEAFSFQDDPQQAGMFNAFIRGSEFWILGYADLEGNAVSLQGEPIGNLSDSRFFQEIVKQKRKRAVEYTQKDALAEQPHLLFAVPVLRDNTLVGVLFAGREQAVLEKSIFSDGFGGAEMVALTDASGNIMALDQDHETHFTAKNIFEDYPSDNMLKGATVEHITQSMRAGGSGSFSVLHEGKEYVVYTPLGVNDWYLLSIVRCSDVTPGYAPAQHLFWGAVGFLTIGFLAAAGLFQLLVKRRTAEVSGEKTQLQRQSALCHAILEDRQSVVYEWNAITQEITTTELFEQLFGYALPKNWFQVIAKRAPEHPEFDYKAVVDAKSRVELTGEKNQVESCLQTEQRGLRRLRITMLPLTDAGKQLSGIYGTISDVTEEGASGQTLTEWEERPAIESMPGSVSEFLLTDSDLLHVFANRRYLDDMGWSEGEFSRQSLLCGMEEGEKKRLVATLHEKHRAKQELAFACPVCKADGTQCWFQVQASFLEEREGGPAYRGIFTEITQLLEKQSELMEKVETLQETNAALDTHLSRQKELEQQLRISQEEYKIAADLINRTVLKYDIPTQTMFVLSRRRGLSFDFSDMLTDAPELAIQKGYIAPESVADVRELFVAIHQGEIKEKILLSFVIQNDQKRWAQVSYSITRDDNGDPATAILSFEDKTEQKQVEEKAHFSNTLLDFSKKFKTMFVVNLVTGTVEYESDNLFTDLTSVQGRQNVKRAVEALMEQHIFEGDSEGCARFFEAERFLAEFEAKNYEDSHDFRYKNEDGSVRWCNVQTRMMRDSYTGDIKLHLLFTDINEQKLTELDLFRRAQSDTLTGLMNREGFVEEFALRCPDPGKKGLYNAVVMIGIDQFKQLNNRIGRDAGDQVLVETARRIRDSLRDDDVVARFSGDEFITLLPGMPSVELIEQRCLRLCNNMRYQLKDDIFVTGSLGIAISPEDGDSFEVLLKKADAAMYQAKEKGGNCCARFNGDEVRHIQSRTEELEAAAEKKTRVFARTFGYFDLFIDGDPVYFTSPKEKELLALLIDRNGGTLTSEEAISILWPDEPAGERQFARYRKVAMRLKNTLQKLGIDDILVVAHGVRNIDVSKIECDYYKFLEGDEEFRKLFNETYMLNYSWGEETTARLIHYNT